jgi:hypothetical protein
MRWGRAGLAGLILLAALAAEAGPVPRVAAEAAEIVARMTTAYDFVIDRTLWLPVAVTELTPEGRLKRTIRFRNQTIVPAFPEDFFRIDEEETADGHPPG